MTQQVSKTLNELNEREMFSFIPYDPEKAEAVAFSGYSYWKSTWHMFIKNRFTRFVLVFIIALLIFTVIQPYIPGQKPPTRIYTDDNGIQLRNIQPNGEFWFGTNNIGQDLWARIWSGTRTTMFIAFVSVAFSTVVGVIIGALWGYIRSLDIFLTEVYNVVNNIPATVLRTLIAYILRPSLSTMIIAMCITSWVYEAKWIRNLIIIIRDREYNLASRCLGTPTRRIIVKNLLPQIVSVLMMDMVISIPDRIGSEVFLTYIGLGLPIDTPSLGNMINEGRRVMMNPSQTYQLIFPAIVVALITIAFYYLGNKFADASDPRNHV